MAMIVCSFLARDALRMLDFSVPKARDTLGPIEPKAELLCARAHLCTGYESQEAVAHVTPDMVISIRCSVVLAWLLTDMRW